MFAINFIALDFHLNPKYEAGSLAAHLLFQLFDVDNRSPPLWMISSLYPTLPAIRKQASGISGNLVDRSVYVSHGQTCDKQHDR